MRDPFPIPPPPALVALVKPYADALNLQTLPLHAHEVLFATGLYFFTCNVVSPFVSARLCPGTYARLSRRTRLNWDVHVVSFVQSVIINALSLWVIWCDEERKAWRDTEHWRQRIWAYYGTGGLCQSFALGYFLWDLVMCTLHIDMFGWGMLAHAVSAVTVFSLGYRPFLYFSAPIFLLYELSSPFLNIHWFCDKLDLTGSIYQAINGVFLTSTFFGCRIVWGIYSSIWVFRDMYWVIRAGHGAVPAAPLATLSTAELLRVAGNATAQATAFNRELHLPVWIPTIYLISNVTLNALNVFWFGKMVATIRARFDKPWGTRVAGQDSDLGVGEPGKAHVAADAKEDEKEDEKEKKVKGSVKAARERAEALNGPVTLTAEAAEAIETQRAVFDDGRKGVGETTASMRQSVRSRRKA